MSPAGNPAAERGGCVESSRLDSPVHTAVDEQVVGGVPIQLQLAAPQCLGRLMIGARLHVEQWGLGIERVRIGIEEEGLLAGKVLLLPDQAHAADQGDRIGQVALGLSKQGRGLRLELGQGRVFPRDAHQRLEQAVSFSRQRKVRSQVDVQVIGTRNPAGMWKLPVQPELFRPGGRTGIEQCVDRAGRPAIRRDALKLVVVFVVGDGRERDIAQRPGQFSGHTASVRGIPVLDREILAAREVFPIALRTTGAIEVAAGRTHEIRIKGQRMIDRRPVGQDGLPRLVGSGHDGAHWLPAASKMGTVGSSRNGALFWIVRA